MLDPALRGKPVGIKQKYLLVTCNYTARGLGVRKMEGVIEAKRQCPSLIVMDGEDLTRYREASEAIFRFEISDPVYKREKQKILFLGSKTHGTPPMIGARHNGVA